MLDPLIRPRLDPILDAWGRRLAARGATADAVTLASLLLGLGGAALIYAGAFLAALALILLGRVADGLDGAVARATGQTDFGGYWDTVADFAFYGAIPLAFALADPAANGAAAAFLLAAFYLNGASFLGFAILAERSGLRSDARGPKAFYHSGGLLEGSETIAFFAALCLFPGAFTPLAAVFGALCVATAAARVLRARRLFGKNPPP